MEHLPPVGWAEVATRHDLERLATKDELYKGLNEQTHRLVIFAVTLNSALAVVVAGIAFAAAKLV